MSALDLGGAAIGARSAIAAAPAARLGFEPGLVPEKLGREPGLVPSWPCGRRPTPVVPVMFGRLPGREIDGELPTPVPGREIDGSDGTLGSDDTDGPDRLVVPTRERIFDFSPSAACWNSCSTPLIFSASATFFWFERKAKYESGMSSKSMTRSHSSQRQVGGSCGPAPMSPASTSRTFSSSHSGQKYGT
jgi:hypothetical protein